MKRAPAPRFVLELVRFPGRLHRQLYSNRDTVSFLLELLPRWYCESAVRLSEAHDVISA